MEEQVLNNINEPISAPKARSLFWQQAFFSLLFLVLGLGIGFWLRGTQSQSQAEIANKAPTLALSSVTPQVTSVDETANWEVYTLKRLKLRFKLPPELSQKGEMIEFTRPSSQQGTVLCFTFSSNQDGAWCQIVSFGMGTISTDFQDGRSPVFTDYLGFAEENGKYIALQNMGGRLELPANAVSLIKNQYGVSLLKIKGIGSLAEEWPGTIVGTPGEGRIGAILNTGDDIYPGLAVEMVLTQELTEKLFTQILSTFQLLP